MKSQGMLCAVRFYFPFSYKQMWTTTVTFIFFCAGGSQVDSFQRLKFDADPKVPLVGTGDKGDLLKMKCIGYIQPEESGLEIDISHIANNTKTIYIHYAYSAEVLRARTINDDLSCCAHQSLCEGFKANFRYNDGNLTVEVIIVHLQCEHSGRWTCSVTSKLAYSITEEKTIDLPAFSPPSDVQITALGVSDTGKLIAMSGTNIVFTCQGNVGSPDGHLFFETVQHRITSETNDQEVFTPDEESEYHQTGCIWTRKATLKLNVSDSDDHKSFKCFVRCASCEHENSTFTNSIITVFIVDTNGTTWHALDNVFMGGTGNPLESSNASSPDTISDCADDVWLIFGVGAGSIIVLVVILESIFYLRKKTRSISWHGF